VNGDLENSPLWGVLVEAVHCLPLYRSHKSYVKEFILSENQGISPEELSERIGVPLGEALVILEELKTEKPEMKGT
jgi:hypothetical protein